jgi:hypothetical protein
MKKLVLALIVALTLAPFSAFGLEMMTDDSMKDVTAQAGVAIAIDDVVLEQHIGATKYIDSDGIGGNVELGVDDFGAATFGGALVIGSRHRIQHINAIYAAAPAASPTVNPGRDETHFTYEAFNVIAPLAIDIGTCPTLSFGLNALKTTLQGAATLYSIGDEATWHAMYFDMMYHMTRTEAFDSATTDVIGVIITLPTVEIYTETDIYSISAEVVETATGATAAAATYHNQGRDYIRICKEASATGILGGRIEIAPK